MPTQMLGYPRIRDVNFFIAVRNLVIITIVRSLIYYNRPKELTLHETVSRQKAHMVWRIDHTQFNLKVIAEVLVPTVL